MQREPALGRVGKKASDECSRAEARQLGGLAQALLGQRNPVIDEVPKGVADQTYVRLQHDDTTAWLEQPANGPELLYHEIA